MSIFRRLIVHAGILLLLASAIGGVGIYSLFRVKGKTERVDRLDQRVQIVNGKL